MSFLTSLDSLEYPINKAIQNFDGTFLDFFFDVISNISIIIGFFGVILSFMIWKKHKLWKPLLFSLMTSGIISYLINEGIYKMLFKEIGIFRPRPWAVHPDLLVIGHAFRDSSFPSSHMAFTTLFVMIMSYFEKRFLPYGIMIILLMGLSRIHNGMHYLSDVLVGIIMGLLYGYAGLFLMKKFSFEKKGWWEKLRKYN